MTWITCEMVPEWGTVIVIVVMEARDAHLVQFTLGEMPLSCEGICAGLATDTSNVEERPFLQRS